MYMPCAQVCVCVCFCATYIGRYVYVCVFVYLCVGVGTFNGVRIYLANENEKIQCLVGSRTEKN